MLNVCVMDDAELPRSSGGSGVCNPDNSFLKLILVSRTALQREDMMRIILNQMDRESSTFEANAISYQPFVQSVFGTK